VAIVASINVAETNGRMIGTQSGADTHNQDRLISPWSLKGRRIRNNTIRAPGILRIIP
jgi:hypothetical protein